MNHKKAPRFWIARLYKRVSPFNLVAGAASHLGLGNFGTGRSHGFFTGSGFFSTALSAAGLLFLAATFAAASTLFTTAGFFGAFLVATTVAAISLLLLAAAFATARFFFVAARRLLARGLLGATAIAFGAAGLLRFLTVVMAAAATVGMSGQGRCKKENW